MLSEFIISKCCNHVNLKSYLFRLAIRFYIRKNWLNEFVSYKRINQWFLNPLAKALHNIKPGNGLRHFPDIPEIILCYRFAASARYRLCSRITAILLRVGLRWMSRNQATILFRRCSSSGSPVVGRVSMVRARLSSATVAAHSALAVVRPLQHFPV